jgi:hypothetical protein
VDPSLVGYDDGQYVREEERRAVGETGPSPAETPEERARRVPMWLVVLAVLALVGVVVGVIVYGYLFKPGWIGVSDKKFWDYLELLIVPAALALGVYWLNRAQIARERKAEEARQRREREVQAAQRERELEVEDQRAQDVALQAYLDQMSQLLIDYELLRAQPDDNLSVVARVRTLTVLPRLDGRRKRSILQFLYESGLIERDGTVVDLKGADLSKANLSEVNLSEVNLSEVNLTILSG